MINPRQAELTSLINTLSLARIDMKEIDCSRRSCITVKKDVSRLSGNEPHREHLIAKGVEMFVTIGRRHVG